MHWANASVCIHLQSSPDHAVQRAPVGKECSEQSPTDGVQLPEQRRVSQVNNTDYQYCKLVLYYVEAACLRRTDTSDLPGSEASMRASNLLALGLSVLLGRVA